MRLTLAVIAATLLARVASAQVPLHNYGEFRVDGITGRGTGVQAGAGVTVPMGIYVRIAFLGAAGSTWRGGQTLFSGRADAIARFMLDPLREMPIGLSFGGGLSAPYDRTRQPLRPYLTGVIDLEGRKRGSFTPAIQLGLGGGTRLGFVLRASSNYR